MGTGTAGRRSAGPPPILSGTRSLQPLTSRVQGGQDGSRRGLEVP